jgi:hypothetical protein
VLEFGRRVLEDITIRLYQEDSIKLRIDISPEIKFDSKGIENLI